MVMRGSSISGAMAGRTGVAEPLSTSPETNPKHKRLMLNITWVEANRGVGVNTLIDHGAHPTFLVVVVSSWDHAGMFM